MMQRTAVRKKKPAKKPSSKGFLSVLGPGLITGASDDDPSGIATYTQAGAEFGFGLLWTLLFTLPLMVAIQEVSARVGRITGVGIVANIKSRYSGWVLYPVVFLLLTANTINIGADIGAMGDALKLVIGGPALAYSVGLAAICVLLQIFLKYEQYARHLKWLTVVLFSYVAIAFTVHVPWGPALRGLTVPVFTASGEYWATFIAVLGTTISPYLFFWQASQETEEIKSHPKQKSLDEDPQQAIGQFKRIRLDTYAGMTFSNVVAFFIILAAAVTLHAKGITKVDTSAQAAEALRPIAGRLTFFLFTLGIVGAGMLAVPVLSGSAAYAVGEAMNWPIGLSCKLRKAKGFYTVLIGSTVIGLVMVIPWVQQRFHISPISALFWSAVINGLVAVPIMAIIMRMSETRKGGGEIVRLPAGLRIMGWITTAVMAAAAVGMFVNWSK
jgi:NRAMP (natural resistance-associated macrophage protein)-like metal ion transporter